MHSAADSAAALARVRETCLALPEVTERISHGTPTWFIRDKKSIATFSDDHHGDGRLAIWCAAAPGEQEALVEEDGDRFYRPPYVGHMGWIGVLLHPKPSWDRVGELLEDAWRIKAPKRLIAEFDASR